MANPNLIEVVDSLAADLRQVPGVRRVTTEQYTPSSIAAHLTPCIGLYEEGLAESHLVGHRRRCTLSVRLDMTIQGQDEARARELRDTLRHEVNYALSQNSTRDGWAVYTDEATQWVVNTLEDPRTLHLQRLVKVYWIEDCLDR
jgi:hypothetical protein